MDNADKMFTVDDVCLYVKIWNLKHTYKILEILSQVYGDINCEIDQHLFNDDQSGFDCELEDFNEQWDDLVNDDDCLNWPLRIYLYLNLN